MCNPFNNRLETNYFEGVKWITTVKKADKYIYIFLN